MILARHAYDILLIDEKVVAHGGAFDAVVDFDKALRDPGHPTRMLAIYDCGDHLHPSDLGYNTVGDAVDLALFD